MTKEENYDELEVEEQDEQEEEVDIDPDSESDEDEDGNEIDWKAEALKERAIKERLKDKLNSSKENLKSSEKPSKQENKPVQKDESDPFSTMKEIALVTKELDSDELEELELQAKEVGVDPVKFARTPVWKSHLKGFRSEKQKSQSTPSPSSRTGSRAARNFSKTVSNDKASSEEKQRAFEAKRDEVLGR